MNRHKIVLYNPKSVFFAMPLSLLAVGISGPWVTPAKYELIEKFKFYNRIAWNRRKWWYSPLQKLAQWRCKNDYYKIPLDKIIIESLKPQPELS